MKVSRIAFIACSLVLSILNSNASETHKYYFNTIDNRNGLSQNTVNAIVQDNTGFMWFGTKEGLNRYDGQSFHIYNKENSGLGRDLISVLFIDRNSNLWVGTDGGVFVYSPQTDSFKPLDMASDTGVIISEAVTGIHEGEGGDIWLSIQKQGLFRYDAGAEKLHNVLPNTGATDITDFFFADGKCWVARYADNLYVTDLECTDSLKVFKDDSGREPFSKDIIDHCLSYGSFIYVASANGLTRIDPETRRTTKLLNAYTRSLEFRNDRELWVGTESGLFIYDLVDNGITHLKAPNQEDRYSLADDAIYSIFKDREGGMWIGSYFGGVNFYPRQNIYFEKFYPHDGMEYFGRRVREICKGPDGELWIGTEDKGLFRYDPEKDTLTPFHHPDLYSNVHGLCLDGDTLWAGTFSGGLNRIDLRSGKLKHYSKEDGNNSLISNNIFSICKTRSGKIYLGTTFGLMCYEPDSDSFSLVEELGNIFIYYVMEDRGGNLWAASYIRGAFRKDSVTGKWKQYSYDKEDPASISSNTVISIHEDTKGDLWFMTMGGGMCLFDPDEENFRRYSTADGLPNNTIYRMVDDLNGNLWVTSNKGLTCFNPADGTTRTYTMEDGLPGNQFNYQSGICDDDGHLYFGSISGMIKFDPDSFKEYSGLPDIVITDFFLSNGPCTPLTPESPLEKSITCSERVVLKHGQNAIAFHIANLNYSTPQRTGLIYRMDGLDEGWRWLAPDHIISYSALPPGNYTLHIASADKTGQPEPNEKALRISIRPPFFLSPFAYFIYALAFMLIIAGIGLFMRDRELQDRRITQERFEREKEHELYNSKIDFFTNIAHEIRTPLTLIKSPLENVLASKDIPEKDKEDLHIMELNTDRLLDLVNQLMDFRKAEKAEFELAFVECDVADMLRQICKRFHPLLQDHNLAFEIDAPKSLKASADKEALLKIFSNLLSNSIKFADTFVLVRLCEDRESMSLYVENDGPVVPVKSRDDIFKPFFQYKTGSASSMHPGTGLGLPMARSLAELHGGALFMDDSTDTNRFILTMPINHSNTLSVLKQDIEVPEEDAGIADERDTTEKTLLLVEDNAELQTFVSRQLTQKFRVLTASDGAEALKVLEKEIVHLIISDIMMPGMDGIELCHTVKSELDFSHIPFILLTAKTNIHTKIEGMRYGADMYIEKPFSINYLKACIDNLLESREKLLKAFAHSPSLSVSSISVSSADEAFLRRLNEVVNRNLQITTFNLEDLAREMNLSKSSLNRKVKGLLELTPNDYIRLERLKKAASLIKDGRYRINEVCYMTGFNSPSYFSKCFQKQFGVLPKEY